MLYLTLRQLEYVVAVAKAGSLTDAGQQLNVSQPALSVAISQVENHLGQKLFLRRKGSPISLTGFAPGFVAEAQEILHRAQRLEDPAALARQQLGRLTIGCFEDIAPFYLAPLLRQLRVHFPDLDVIAQVASFEILANGLLDGSTDLALTYDLGLDASFEKSELTRVSPNAFFASDDPLADAGPIRLQDLENRPLILFEEGQSIRHMLSLFNRLGLKPKIAHRAASLEVMRSLAANGEGVGISYTTPPSQHSYDGKRVCTAGITDPEAAEPIILARLGTGPAIAPMPQIISFIKGFGVFTS